MKDGFAFIDLLAALCVAAIGVAALARLSGATASSVARLKPALVEETLPEVACSANHKADGAICTAEKRSFTVLARTARVFPP